VSAGGPHRYQRYRTFPSRRSEDFIVQAFTDFMGKPMVFWPLVGVAVLLIVVFVVMRMKGKDDDE